MNSKNSVTNTDDVNLNWKVANWIQTKQRGQNRSKFSSFGPKNLIAMTLVRKRPDRTIGIKKMRKSFGKIGLKIQQTRNARRVFLSGWWFLQISHNNMLANSGNLESSSCEIKNEKDKAVCLLLDMVLDFCTYESIRKVLKSMWIWI